MEDAYQLWPTEPKGQILAVTLVGLLTLYVSVGSVLKHLLERIGTLALETQVKIRRVSVRPLRLKIVVKDIEIENLPEYRNRYFLTLRRVEIRVNTRLLLAKPRAVSEILIVKPEVSYELSMSKNNNIQALLSKIDDKDKTANSEERLNQASSLSGEPGSQDNKQPSKQKERAPGTKRTFTIDKLNVTDADVLVDARDLGGTTFHVYPGDFSLTALGENEGGITTADLFRIISGAIANTALVNTKMSSQVVKEKIQTMAASAVDTLKTYFSSTTVMTEECTSE